jgi:hypothetical protein
MDWRHRLADQLARELPHNLDVAIVRCCASASGLVIGPSASVR